MNYRPLLELVPAHWQTGSIDVEDGIRIHYIRTGSEKPALLLLHGFQSIGLMWLRTALAMEADYDVVMPDFRGHGASGDTRHGFSTELLVSDTTSLIRALNLDTPFVVGHSMGAEIAGRLAADYPVRAAALVDPALRNFAEMFKTDDDSLPPWMQPILETIQALRQQPHEERITTGLRLLPPGTPAWDEADYMSFVEGQAQFDLNVFRFASRMGYLFESPEVIEKISCPLLLMTARPMMPGPQPGIAAFENHWRSGERLHFEDSGHFIMFDQFSRFIEALRRFLH